MTRQHSSSKTDVEVWNEGDAVEPERTKVGDDSLALAEALRAAQLEKETRKATAFDLEAALARARPSIPDGIRASGGWAHAVLNLVLLAALVAAAVLLLRG